MRQRVIDEINSLTNFEYWIYEEQFMKFLDIATLFDEGKTLTEKQKKCLEAFLERNKENVG